jgi:hypothetical protein
MLQDALIEIRPPFRLFEDLHQRSRFPWDALDIPFQDLRHGDSLVVEFGVLVVSLDDDRPIDLEPAVQAARFHIRPDGLPILHHLRIDDPTDTERARHNAQFSPETDSDFGECGEGITGIDHAYAVVDIDTGHETHAKGMDQDSGRGRPGPVFFARD